jgi:type IV pilus assembly protein PilB
MDTIKPKQMIQFDEDKENKKVDEFRKKEEEELAEMLARRFDLQYVNLSVTPINSDALRLVEEDKARVAKFAPYNKVDKKIELAVLSPKNETTLSAVKELEERGYTPVMAVASIDSLNKAWATYKDLSFASETKAGSLEVSNEEISDLLKKVKTTDDIKKYITDVLSQNKGYRISKIFEIILAGALATGASDVHIEPEEAYVRLRYRLDGVLHDILTFDRDTYSLLLARVKLLSGMKLNIKDDSQDGRLSVKIEDMDIEIRASALPGAYSESIVLRILNPKSIAVPLEELGIHPKLLEVLEKQIAKPEGMILTTGPTGSGKTTTLYAFLKRVHTSDIKIITIEDPIEYHLPGIVQTQADVEKGYTFLQGLRAALRQDPDIIMIGEIRDNETAEIAVNSAQTGHLVFSTLHTNSAAGTFPRLIDLGVNPKTVTSAINVAMAQRLVRKLCPFCKKESPLDEKKKILLSNILASLADKTYLEPLEPVGKENAKENARYKENILAPHTHWLPGGCEKCNMTGYKGRVGIYEAILRDQMIEEIVVSDPSEREIKKAALPQGLANMRQDGVLKVLQAITSIDELERVIDLEGY